MVVISTYLLFLTSEIIFLFSALFFFGLAFAFHLGFIIRIAFLKFEYNANRWLYILGFSCSAISLTICIIYNFSGQLFPNGIVEIATLNVIIWVASDFVRLKFSDK